MQPPEWKTASLLPTSLPDQANVFGHDAAEALVAVTQASTTIEAEDEGFSEDSYGSDTASTGSVSISPSVRDFAFENGRRYHKYREGLYVFPNDVPEQEREDMKHAMVVNLCGGTLHFAPIGDNPQNIIDLGTGSGAWCIDMGDEYPSAEIVGVDLSPIQPVWVPPNVKFIVDDVEAPWLVRENLYDLVHGRHVTQAFKDFPTLLGRAYDHVKPGGWIEFQEFHHDPHCDDGSMPPDFVLSNYFRVITQGLGNLGIHLDGSREEAANLSKYGFINVEHRIMKIPIGTWAKSKTLKTVGLYANVGISDGLQGMAFGPLCRGLGWTREQVEAMLVDVRKSLADKTVHSYLPFHVIYGQKPLGDDYPMTY